MRYILGTAGGWLGSGQALLWQPGAPQGCGTHAAQSPQQRPFSSSSPSSSSLFFLQGSGPVSLEIDVPVSLWQCLASSCRDKGPWEACGHQTALSVAQNGLVLVRLAAQWINRECVGTSPVTLCVSCMALVVVMIILPSVAVTGNRDAECPALK